jgi:hypothetical protein
MTVPVPAKSYFLVEVEDIAGQHSLITINAEYCPDAVGASDTFFLLEVGTALGFVYNSSNAPVLAGAIQALTNAKVVRAGFAAMADFASEPSSESGKQQFVQSKAKLHFLDGKGYQNAISIPAPVDALFLTGVGMQTVVNPALSLAGGGGIIGALQTAVANSGAKTPSGGVWGTQFQGGELVIGKAPKRRRIQGQ